MYMECKVGMSVSMYVCKFQSKGSVKLHQSAFNTGV